MTTGADWQDRVGRTWAEMHQRTDRSFGNLTDELLKRTRGIGLIGALDIGCGAGELSCALARGRGSMRVQGLDVSAALLKVARDRGKSLPNLTFVQADATTWEDPTFSPDLLVSRHGVMFFDDPVAAFVNLRRQSSSGATFVFSCFRAPSENEWIGTLAAIDPGVAQSQTSPSVPGPFAFADRSAVETLLTDAGWSEPDFQPVDYAMVVGLGANAIDEALAYFLRIGPLARYFAGLDGAAHGRAIARLRRILARHEHGGMVAMGAAAWIVTARCPD